VARSGTDGAQHGNLSSPLVQRRENGGQHAEQSRDEHEAGNHEEKLFDGRDGSPELRQRGTGQDRGHRFGLILVDFTLHLERLRAVLEPHHEGGNRRRGQIELQRLIGIELHT
jgi:hypothetical protein